MASQITWLKCKVSPGQFSGEYAVSAIDHAGAEFSLFTADSNVEHECEEIGEGSECKGRVRVVVLGEKGDLTLVRLPGRTFANGSTVTVRSDQIEVGESSYI